MRHKLYGSVHPHDRKQATATLEVTPLVRPPAYVVLPTLMHSGEPCRPVVEPGERVLLGQVIAEPTGLGAPVHASVSGTVAAVEPRPHPCGTPVLSVVIKNDFTDTPAPPMTRKTEPQYLTGWEVAELVAQAGIVGLSGKGFPTAVKLKESISRVDTLIINGTECEPYITSDHRLMLEESERVVGGIKVLMRSVGARRACIGIEVNKPDAIRKLRALLAEEKNIQVVALKTRYPQGGEKMLVQKLTGRQIPPGGLPGDVKCVTFNVATAAAVYDAVFEGKPLTHRIVTVSGGAVAEPRNVRVPIGTSLEHLLEDCGGLIREPGRVLLGGPMMGQALSDLSAPVLKTTSSLLFLRKAECGPVNRGASACIRCGRCAAACPMHLSPMTFELYISKGRYAPLEELDIMDCAQCGSCAYACPAHIPLVEHIRAAREVLSTQAALEKTDPTPSGKEALP